MASDKCNVFQIICTSSMSLHIITYALRLIFSSKLVTQVFNFDFCKHIEDSEEKLNLEVHVRSSLWCIS